MQTLIEAFNCFTNLIIFLLLAPIAILSALFGFLADVLDFFIGVVIGDGD